MKAEPHSTYPHEGNVDFTAELDYRTDQDLATMKT